MGRNPRPSPDCGDCAALDTVQRVGGTSWTRRRILGEGARLGVVGLGLTLPAAGIARAAEACLGPAGPTAEQAALRRSFHYQARSPLGAAKRCDGCEYFAARAAAPAGCGDCLMLHGIVDVGGYCDAFSEKG